MKQLNSIIRDIKTLFLQEEEYYCKTVIISNVRNNDYIKYESNSDRNKNVSVKEYLNVIKPYLKDMIIDLQISDMWKIQLTIAINFISSKDVDEQCVMHSKSENIEVMLYDDAYEVLIKFLSHFFWDTTLV